MGYWNETCGFSGLPITPGTPSLLFLLGPGSSIDDGRSGFSYPNGQWKLLCLPFRGEYNSYGTIDLPPTPPVHWKLTEDILKDHKLAWRDGRYEKPEEPLQVAYDQESFFDRIERGWVHGVGYMGRREDGNKFPVGQMLVREDVWSTILNLNYDTWYMNANRERGQADAREWLAYVLANKPKDMGGAFDIENHFSRGEKGRDSIFFQSMHGSSESGCGVSLYRHPITHGLAFDEIDESLALSVLYEMNDTFHVNRVLWGLRRAWRPQTGKGSQDTAWKLHETFDRTIADLAASFAATEES